ncbi:hypothetical protein TNCV_2173522 [Trichonephila clavipes]|nr:hypothetical protein TNCV_2173522 [Trichonephila clavipes]
MSCKLKNIECHLNHTLLSVLCSIDALGYTQNTPEEATLLHAFRRVKKLMLRQMLPFTSSNEHHDYAQKVKMSENTAILKKEPPYMVTESGYAGFTMPIDVYFRTKEEPRKVKYIYDLYLKVGHAVNNIRIEKLTFQNPHEDFRKKLLLAGAVLASGVLFNFFVLDGTPRTS